MFKLNDLRDMTLLSKKFGHAKHENNKWGHTKKIKMFNFMKQQFWAIVLGKKYFVNGHILFFWGAGILTNTKTIHILTNQEQTYN